MDASPMRRSRPFKQPNLLTNVVALTQGPPMATKHGWRNESDIQDEQQPPSKKRRTDAAAAAAAAAAATTATAVETKAESRQPCPSQAIRPQSLDQLLLPAKTKENDHVLRIEVLKIIHRSSARVKVKDMVSGNRMQAPSIRDMTLTRARCKLTIAYTSPAFPREPQVLHCQSQLCDLRSFKTMASPFPMARIYLKEPFYVPQENIWVTRDDDGSFDFADSYSITVELEPAGDRNWPPLDLASGTTTSRDADVFSKTGPAQRWVLSSNVTDLFSRSRAYGSLQVKKSARSDPQPSQYVMDVDLRWSAGIEIKPLEKGVLPSIHAIDDDHEPQARETTTEEGPGPLRELGDAQTNGGHGGLDLDHGDEEDETTPNRSLRQRAITKNYNLKDLSAKAHGKEPKRRKRAQRALEEGRVFYSLPAEQVVLDYFRCIACGLPHQSLALLQMHHIANHGDYNFELIANGREPHFSVTHHYEVLECPTKTYQLGKPTMPLDLDKFTNECDMSWYMARIGPLTDSSLGPPVNSRAVSAKFKKAQPPPQKVVVPESSHPFYQPIAWTKLEPGTEVKRSAADMRWLIQKHQESLADFSDVTPAEKEMCMAWDAFIIDKRITSDVYLPRAWLEFVHTKASWLVASKTRMIEFAKHYAYLLARDALDDETTQQGFAILRKAREQKAANGAARPQEDSANISPKGTHTRKSAGGCTTCGKPVVGARLLVCHNEDCRRPLYHSDCAAETAGMSVEAINWLCNACAGHQGPGRGS